MQTNNTYGANVVARFIVVFLFIAMLAIFFIVFPASALKENKKEKSISVKENSFRLPLSQPLPFAMTGIQYNGSLEMKLVTDGLENLQQLSYHLPANNLLMSSGQPDKLSFFANNKQRDFFSNENSIKIQSLTTSSDPNGKFPVGEVFVGTDKGIIFRIDADGVSKQIKLLREKASVDGGLVVDSRNVFDGDLIAVVGNGRIWRVDEHGKANLLVNLNVPLKGATIIPNDEKLYGWFAGKLIVGATKERGIYAIDSNGQSNFYPLNIKPNDIDLIQENQNLFAISSKTKKLFEVDKNSFTNSVGDILITSADTKELFSLHFNGNDFQTSSFTLKEEVNQVTFAPITLSSDTAACVTSLSQNQNVFQWTGGEGSFDVIAPSGCNWTAMSNSAWLNIISGQNGTGNGTVTYTVAKNSTYFLREGDVTVDMLSHHVSQSRKAQLHCVLDFNPSNPNIPAIGGSGTINITGSDECVWQAVSDSPWLTLTGNVFGRGNGSISYAVSTNFAGTTRQGTILFGRDAGALIFTQSPNLAPVVNAGADQIIALPNTASLNGTATDDGIGNPVTVSWSKLSGPETVLFSNANTQTNTAIFNKEGTYVLRLTASDGYLTSTDDVTITVNADPVPPPPDPATVAPPLDPTVPTNTFEATKFLYTGTNPIQTGVNPNDIKAERVGLLRGKVTSKDGTPLSKVKISVMNHTEFGQTLTRADGMFDMVVNGGGELVVKYEKNGFISVQREEKIDWQVYDRFDDVVMIPYDGNVTTIDLAAQIPIQVASGSLSSDSAGQRRSRLFFKQGTTATIHLPNGPTQSTSLMNVRATEFTVGTNGPETMPAALPTTSEYTYASEYSVDEAVALGATNVSFSQPVIQYLENFIGFPTGVSVPTGSYNRVTAEWEAEPSGKVVKILTITDGIANLDVTGSGLPATDAEYAALGINTAERQKLAEFYTVNQTLWRVPLDHFTPWDCNYPPADRPPPDVAPPFIERKPKKDCEEEDGCVTEIQSQTVRETIEINHEGYQITYDSSTQDGGGIAAIPLVGPTPMPSDLEQVAAIVTVAGQTTRSDLMVPSPNLSLNYTWDGKDFAGRRVQGPQTASVKIVHLYPIGYVLTDEFGQTGNGGGQTFVRTGTGITTRDFEIEFGNLDRGQMGLGGWSLNVHHTYDPVTQTLYEGNGQQRHASRVSSVVNTTAGTGVSGFDGDGGQASNAKLFEPSDIAFAPDGSYYIADRLNNRVRRVTRDGIISTFAGDGTGSCPSTLPCGDGGLAVNAQLSDIGGVAVAPDGSVFVTDTNRNRIRKIGTDGVITTVAGNGTACVPTAVCGDGGLATSASLNQPKYIHLADDGSMYIGDSDSNRVRKVGTNGKITTIAGSGGTNCPSNNVPARMACIESPTGVALDDNGSLYITGNGQNNARVFRLDTNGIIRVLVTGDPCNGASPTELSAGVPPSVCNPRGITIGPDGNPYFAADNRIFKIDTDGTLKPAIGTLDNSYNGEGQPVTTANFSLPASATFAPDGNIYVAAANEHRIRKVTPTFPGFTGNDNLIPSEDGTEVFQFDANGRHLRTLNALTGTNKYVFGYNAEGSLTSITDGDNNITTIERDAVGKPTGIRSPYGQLTTLTLDTNGYIASVSNPAGESNRYTYTSGGLMLTKRDPLNNLNTFTYDAQGRLIRNDNSAGGSHTLSRTGNAQDYTATYRSPLNRASTFQVQNLPNGDEKQINTFEDGTVYRVTTAADGSTSDISPDGSTSQTTLGPDPRWGMQAPLESNAGVMTPGGLNFNSTFTRTSTLATPGNPLNLTTQTDTLSINARTYTSVFTASNRTFALTTPQNRQSTAVIDWQERVTQAQFADLNAGNYTYDTRGRLSIAAFGSGASARTFNFAYNTAGFLSSSTNPLNQTTAFTYDLAGRVTQQTLADNRNIAFGYDSNGNLTSLTPPGRPAHTFTYNSLNLVSSYVAPNIGGSSTTTYEYNLDRDISRITRPDSLQINYAYDTGGRLQTLTVPTGSYGFAYNATTGLLSSITAPGGGLVAYQYDGFLPTRQTWTGTVAGNVSQTFDNNFRITSQSINGANTVDFTYDNDNLLTGAGSLALTRNTTNGLLVGTTLSNVTDTYTYNGFAEPTNYNAKFNATTLYDVNVTYDKLGRITQKVETIGGIATTYDYGYDSTGKLMTVTLNGAPQPLVIYSYDSNDNRTSVNLGGIITNAITDAQDRLTQYGNTTYTYTLNGELQSKTNASQTTQYSYDVLGNLRNVTLPDTTQIEYVIDGQNRRIGKRVNGTLTQGFLYQNQLEPVAELDGSNNIVSRFVYGTSSNVPDYMIKNGVTYRIIADQVGSVRLVVDTATGNIAQRIDYDEFGVVLMDTNPNFQPFGFAGGLYDTQTKLTRFGARDYDAETGRWTNKDPILFAGGDTNLYVYCFNNPIGVIDPNGLGPSINPSKITSDVLNGLSDLAQELSLPFNSIEVLVRIKNELLIEETKLQKITKQTTQQILNKCKNKKYKPTEDEIKQIKVSERIFRIQQILETKGYLDTANNLTKVLTPVDTLKSEGPKVIYDAGQKVGPWGTNVGGGLAGQ